MSQCKDCKYWVDVGQDVPDDLPRCVVLPKMEWRAGDELACRDFEAALIQCRDCTHFDPALERKCSKITGTATKENSPVCSYFESRRTYKKIVDDKPQRAVERCEIVTTSGIWGDVLACRRKGDPSESSIFSAQADPDFIGYEYENGEIWSIPCLYGNPYNSSIPWGPMKKSEIHLMGSDGLIRPKYVLFYSKPKGEGEQK